MLKPRKSKTSLAVVTRYADSELGFPEGFALYLGKRRIDYIDGVAVGLHVSIVHDNQLPIFEHKKVTRIIFRKLQSGYVHATIGMGAKYYGLRKLKELPKSKPTYIEELQESLFGKPDFSRIGINAHQDEGNLSTMDKLFKGGIRDGSLPLLPSLGDRHQQPAPELYERVRKLAGINAGDEAVALDVVRSLQRREFKEGDAFTFDSMSQHPDVLKGEEDC